MKTKAERAAYMAAYRVKNREKLLAPTKAYLAQYRRAHRNIIREKARQYYARHRKELATYQRNYRKQHPNIKYPERIAARMTVARALKSGTITRPNLCSRCSKKCKPQGHHPNYAQPLNVIWLCKRCHEDEHRLLRSLT